MPQTSMIFTIGYSQLFIDMHIQLIYIRHLKKEVLTKQNSPFYSWRPNIHAWIKTGKDLVFTITIQLIHRSALESAPM